MCFVNYNTDTYSVKIDKNICTKTQLHPKIVMIGRSRLNTLEFTLCPENLEKCCHLILYRLNAAFFIACNTVSIQPCCMDDILQLHFY